jgi:hypothetical protein
MGKRELLIAITFVAIGAVVYQFTATPARPGEGFSWSRLWTRARQSVQADRASAKITSTQTIVVPASVRELRLANISGAITITGETRPDISVEFGVQSSGPDDAQALARAKTTHLKVDTLEDAIVLGTTYPTGGQQVSSLTLKVPKRLAAKIAGGNGIRVSDLEALQLSASAGPGVLSRIRGLIGGDFRSGTLQIADAGSLDLTITGGQTTIAGVHGTARLDVRSGRCSLGGNAGPVEIDARQADLDITGNTGSVRIGGQGGHVRIVAPRAEVRIDMRRAGLTVELQHAVPMSLSTTEGTIDLKLGAPAGAAGDAPPIDVDAIASDGDVVASDWHLMPTKIDHESRLAHAFGKTALVSLRTTRGDIVITKRGR